jgi:Holliday junction resolvase
MKGLGKRLRSGQMLVMPDRRVVEIRSAVGELIDTIAYGELVGTDWGYIYERHVGQYLEENGFEVDLRGLTRGFADGGIDIIASKGGERVFIQCKHAAVGKLSKQRMEWILYKASAFLNKEYNGKKLTFWLVVPSMQSAFVKAKSKNQKSEYPMASYFLSKNAAQSKVKLEIHEISMQR